MTSWRPKGKLRVFIFHKRNNIQISLYIIECSSSDDIYGDVKYKRGKMCVLVTVRQCLFPVRHLFSSSFLDTAKAKCFTTLDFKTRFTNSVTQLFPFATCGVRYQYKMYPGCEIGPGFCARYDWAHYDWLWWCHQVIIGCWLRVSHKNGEWLDGERYIATEMFYKETIPTI